MDTQVKEFEMLSELLDDLDREGITGVQRMHHMENFLLRKSRLHGRPYCASFELTPLCNFDCKMCYMHLSREQMEQQGRILTTDEWLDIACQAVDAGITCADLTGGECLTHPGFKEIYRYLTERGIHTCVLTNAQLIRDEHIALFRRYRPSAVQISLYGSSPEGYLRVTGRDGFHDVLNAVSSLKAAGIRVQLSVTPNRFMQEDMAGILDLLHKLNVDYRIGSTTLPARPDTGRCIADYIIDNQAYVALCKMESEYRKALARNPAVTHEKPYQFRIKGQETFAGAPCSAGAAHFHINWKGEMSPCIGFHAVTKSVFEEGLEAAWVWIRDTMKQYRPPEECAGCELQSACVGCCAEKCGGVLNGDLNPWVCKRMRETRMPSPMPNDALCER